MTALALVRLTRLSLSREKKGVAFSAFGVAMGVGSLVFFVALGLGVDKVVREKVFPVDAQLLDVVPPTLSLGAILGGGKIDEATVERLSAIAGVETVYRKMNVRVPAVSRYEGDFFGSRLRMGIEVLAVGVDPGLVKKDVQMGDFSDPGPDKPIPWWPEAPIAPLGWQGSRLYGLETISSVLDAELTALEDMGRDGRLSLLVPYLTHPWEFEAIRARLQRWPRLARLPLGAMVETPAAAFALPEWRAKADFVGIGCNDLMQAFHATDRNRPELDRWLDPYAPAWLRFLTRLAEEGRGLGLPLRICGQLPGVPGFFPLLLGMGFRAFSVEPVMIPTLGHIARTMDAGVAHDLLGQACRASTSAEVRTLLGLSPDRPGR